MEQTNRMSISELEPATNRPLAADGRFKSKDIGITDLNLEIYSHFIGGWNIEDIANKYQISEDTTYYHIKRCKDTLKDVNIEELRRAALGLYPKAMKAINHGLEQNDQKTAVSVMKGLQVFVPKQVSESKKVEFRAKLIATRLQTAHQQAGNSDAITADYEVMPDKPDPEDIPYNGA